MSDNSLQARQLPEEHPLVRRATTWDDAWWARAIKRAEKKGRPICGGVKKTDGGICERRPLKDRTHGRCRDHAGKSLQGAAHPNFKHGRYVGQRLGHALPAPLRDLFDIALKDPNLVSLRNEIASTEAQKIEAWEVESQGRGTIDQWDEIGYILGALDVEEGEVAELKTALQRIAEVHSEWAETMKHRAFIRQLETHGSKLKEKEIALMKAAGEYVQRAKALAMAGAMTMALREVVKDKQVVQEVQGRFATIARGAGLLKGGDE